MIKLSLIIAFVTLLLQCNAQFSRRIETKLVSSWPRSKVSTIEEAGEIVSEFQPELYWRYIEEFPVIEDLNSTTPELIDEYIFKTVESVLSKHHANFVKYGVGMKGSSVSVQAQYEIAKLSKGFSKYIWYDIGETSYCDIKDIEKAIKDYLSDKDIVRNGIYNGDHIHPFSDLNSNYKIVLYGNPASKQLKEYHKMILPLVKENHLIYILRVIPAEIVKDKTELVGYSTLDDRKVDNTKSTSDEETDDKKEEIHEIIEGFNITKLKERYPNQTNQIIQFKESLLSEEENSVIDVWEMQNLGIQSIEMIIQSADPFDKLRDISWNFPSYVSSISRVKVEPKVQKELDSLQSSIQAGGNELLINGQSISLDRFNFNYFNIQKMIMNDINNELLLNKLDLDKDIIKHFEKVYNSNKKGKKQNADDDDDELGGLFGEEFGDGDDDDITEDISDVIRINLLDNNWKQSIYFINNLEKDSRYKRWNGDIRYILQPSWQLPSVKKNLYSVIYIINPSTVEGLNLLGGIGYYVSMNVPIRFGVILSDPSLIKCNRTDWINCEEMKDDGNIDEQAKINTRIFNKIFLFLYTKYSKQVIQSFLNQLQSIQEVPKVKDIIQKGINAMQKSKTIKPIKYNELLEILKTNEFDDRIKIATSYLISKGLTSFPLITINGLVYPNADLNSMMNYIGPILYELQRLVYNGEVTANTDILEYYSKSSGTYKKYHPQFIQSVDKREYVLLLSYSPEISNSAEYYINHIKYYYNKIPLDKIFIHNYILYGDYSKPEMWEYTVELFKHILNNVNVRCSFVHYSKSSTNEIGDFISKVISIGYDYEDITKASSYVSLFFSNLIAYKNSNTEITLDLVQKLFYMRFQGLFSDEKTLKEMIESKDIYISPEIPSSFNIEPDVTTLFYNGRIIREIDTILSDDLGILENTEKNSNNQAYKTITGQPHKDNFETITYLLFLSYIHTHSSSSIRSLGLPRKYQYVLLKQQNEAVKKDKNYPVVTIEAIVNPLSEECQRIMGIIDTLRNGLKDYIELYIYLNPSREISSFPLKRFYRFVGINSNNEALFLEPPKKQVLTMGTETPESWIVQTYKAEHDLDNIQMSSDNVLHTGGLVYAEYKLTNIVIQGSCIDLTHGGTPPHGLQLVMTNNKNYKTDSLVMQNMAYYQLKGDAGIWNIELADGRAKELYSIVDKDIVNKIKYLDIEEIRKHTVQSTQMIIRDFYANYDSLYVVKNEGKESESVLEKEAEVSSSWFGKMKESIMGKNMKMGKNETINIFSLASGHLYERFIKIMMMSVVKRTSNPVKFWLVENFFSPAFKSFIPHYAKELGCEVELVTYKWPKWLHPQTEKQRIIWAYKFLFLDVLFPLNLKKVIYVDADQVMRSDLKELYEIDLHGAPYAYTPFCDSNKDTLGFQFWRHGYWADHLQGRPYHISALYVVDLDVFRKRGVGDILRSIYDTLSRDPNSLSNLDQDLPNYAQTRVPIYSLPQEWLWCESWCSNSTKKNAKTIDLCNNPMYKEPKLDMARRIISGNLFPESWIELDNAVHEIEMKYN